MEMRIDGTSHSTGDPEKRFTGIVREDPLFPANGERRPGAVTVTFQAGARTAWHTHALGQTLIVTAGLGLAQRDGGPVEEIRPGDLVWFEPDEKHWHGASPKVAMTHIAIQEEKDGRVVDWLEHVTDAQYQATSHAMPASVEDGRERVGSLPPARNRNRSAGRHRTLDGQDMKQPTVDDVVRRV